MKAVIYARKSTLQRGDEETKSIARQIADARAFAVRLGVPSIDDRCVYADDAVLGADVKNLRARAKLIADVRAGKIDVVIMADMSRFSRREGHEVVAELEEIARKAAVYFYESGSRYLFGDIGANIANYAIAEVNADYRRKVRTKTIAAMKHKAEHGHVLGPAPFGYRNRDVLTGATDGSGRPIRSHVTREVYEPEANVVREIFDRYATGQGLKKIADALNRKNTPTPRPRKLKDQDGVVRPIRNRGDWRPSNVRSILLQPLYRGVARWNRLKQHDEKGNSILVVNPESDHVTKFNPDWQIVSNGVAENVDARFADENRKKFCAKPGDRARHLLSGGMLLCPACGGRFEVLSNGKYKYYVCSTRRHAGKAACANPLALRVQAMDDAILGLLDREVLHAKFVDHVVNLACGNAVDDARTEIEAQRDEVNLKIKRLMVVAQGTDFDIPEVMDALKARKAERDALDRRLAALAEPIDRAALRSALEQRSADWRQRLRSDYPAEARYVVEQLIGPLTLWFGNAEDLEIADAADPTDDRGTEGIDFSDCGFTAVVRPAGLLNGLVAASLVAGAGFEPATFGL